MKRAEPGGASQIVEGGRLLRLVDHLTRPDDALGDRGRTVCLRPTLKASPESRALRFNAGVEKANVGPSRQTRRARGPAIDARRFDRIDERAVRPAVAPEQTIPFGVVSPGIHRGHTI